MDDNPAPRQESLPPRRRPFDLRGFTLQFLLVGILPLSVLLLVVAFGSQTLHHDAMRSLVGDRDLLTVKAASSSLEREIDRLAGALAVLARSAGADGDLSRLVFSPAEISSLFDGGLALYRPGGTLLSASASQLDWQALPRQLPAFFQTAADAPGGVHFSSLVSPQPGQPAYVLAAVGAENGTLLAAAFSPARLVENALGGLAQAGEMTVLVVGPAAAPGEYDVLFRSGPFRMDQSVPAHPGILEALSGASGINYFQSAEGEHVVAYSPIAATGWGLVIEEAWEDIASPYLMNTQSAPLVLVPVFLLALLAIGFGARRIVTPLQKLEKQAALLAAGNFEAIRPPVGGIDEIRKLQAELIQMADTLWAAQQNLRSYIGAITASVENERRSLARELHDDTIQTLIAFNQRIQLIAMQAPEAQQAALAELRDLVQQSMTRLRRMVRGLRPIYLEDLGLTASLEMLVREVEQSASLPITFAARGQEVAFDPNTAVALYRMVQESLSNVVRHAQARRAWVEVDYSGRECTLRIRDDGKGFAVPSHPAEFPRQGHFGLLGLQERADLINARLSIDSRPGKGTAVTIRVPLPDREG